MSKKYSEKDLIIPALLELYISDYKSLSTTKLIAALTNRLKPEGEDAEILFGRNDTRFSQKVRNLISHKSLYPAFVDYDAKNHMIKINENGIKYLESYYDGNVMAYNNKENMQEDTFDGQDSLDEIADFDFAEKSYVSVESINCSVYELKRKYDRTRLNRLNNQEVKNGLILDESFQRTGSAWSSKQKCQLIESVIMDVPLPFIYLAESAKGNLVVIDGRQRLTALFEFLDDNYPLRYLTFVPQLNKKRVRDLTGDFEKFKTKIEDAHLYIIKIKSTTPENLKLQIFSRVNRNGTPLNSQEIRHALHQGEVTKLLGEISDKYEILNRTRMKDRYLVLRYISMRLFVLNKLFNYTTNKNIEYKDINSFLAESMDAINSFDENQINEIYLDFCATYEKALQLLENDAFRLNSNSPINMIWFEVTLSLISFCGNRINKDNIKDILERYKSIDADCINEYGETPFYQNLKYHRDSKENFYTRIKWINKIVEEVLNVE